MQQQPPVTVAVRRGTLRRLHGLIRSNWLSSFGAALMTLAVFGLVTLFALHSVAGGQWAGPYMGLVFTIVLPAVFVAGLVFVPLGILVYRRRVRERIATMVDKPMSLVRAVVALTAINFAAVATIGYGATSYMSSSEFCGKACHAAMQPEYDTWLQSVHNRIGCVPCHVEPTARGFVAAKVNGTRQLIDFLRDDYERPIPTPIHGQVPAEATCETCHWPEKYLGTKIKVLPHYRTDEQVTGYTNVLLMRTGGTRPDGESVGIHWHVHPSATVRFFATDAKMLDVPVVEVLKPDGQQDVFTVAGVDPAKLPAGRWRAMDCVDCHNRVGHHFELPDEALDKAIASGLVARELPGIKAQALAALEKPWTRANAADGIRDHLRSAYRALDAQGQQRLDRTMEQVVRIWLRNVYPDRGVTWGTYPSLSSHTGCFRCHDGKHANAAGKVISNECKLCHTVLSENEENPAVLETFGIGR
jgi:hypothetical protein